MKPLEKQFQAIQIEEELEKYTMEFDVEAVVTYYPNQAESRAIPVASGYQPKFHFDDESWAVEHEYADASLVYPGDRVTVFFRFFDSRVSLEDIYRGMSFELKEGEKTVGEGTVLGMGK